MHLTKFNNTYLILLGVSLNTDSICQISFEKSELCMFEGESDFWVKFGTIERGRGGGGGGSQCESCDSVLFFY